MTFLFGAGYWHAPIRPRLGYVLVSLRAYASFLGLFRPLGSIRPFCAGYFALWAQYACVSAMCSFHFAHTPRFWGYFARWAQYAPFAQAISPVGLNMPASRLCARFTARIRLVFGLRCRYSLFPCSSRSDKSIWYFLARRLK